MKKQIIVASALVVAACARNAAILDSNFHPTNRGWTLVWLDNFPDEVIGSEELEVNPSRWIVTEFCGGYNGEQQCYTDRFDNVVVENHLVIRARHETCSGRPLEYVDENSIAYDDSANVGHDCEDTGAPEFQSYQYTSGRIESRIPIEYGRVEVRAKLPYGLGTWPAIWLLPVGNDYGGWPMSGEIDMLEAVNLDQDLNGDGNLTGIEIVPPADALQSNLHFCSDAPSSWKLWQIDTDYEANTVANRCDPAINPPPNPVSSGGLSGSVFAQPKRHWPMSVVRGDDFDFDPGADFHTYAIEWERTQIRFFVDDVHIGTAFPVFTPFDQPFRLIINLAVGGDMPCSPQISGLPTPCPPQPGDANDWSGDGPDLRVDWVRVYNCRNGQPTSRCIARQAGLGPYEME